MNVYLDTDLLLPEFDKRDTDPTLPRNGTDLISPSSIAILTRRNPLQYGPHTTAFQVLTYSAKKQIQFGSFLHLKRQKNMARIVNPGHT